MMRHLHVLIDEDTYNTLKSLTTYRGELSGIVRIILQNFASKIKEKGITTAIQQVKGIIDEES